MIVEKVKQLQVKHFIQITVCILGIYLFRNKQSYQFQPAWRKDFDLSLYENNQFPVKSERLPSPIVTDMDGDEKMEVVLVTNDWKLQITQYKQRKTVNKRLPYLDILYSHSLLQDEGHTASGARPTVMETGFLDKYEENKNRTQVIVLMYSSWLVQCYDHRLVLLWQRVMLDVGPAPSEYSVLSMAVLITPHKLHPIDRGLIIVGASYTQKGHSHSSDGFSELISDEPHATVDGSAFTKFSAFAISGLNGTIKWQHQPHQTNKASQSEEASHHWKLSLKRGSWSQGGSHWSKYGLYLLKHMPHQWHHLKDTKFDLTDIHHLQDDRKNDKSELGISPLDDLGTRHLIGLAFGGLRPHSRHEHVTNPSGVVVHNDRGLELLSLSSGQLITQLVLDKHNAVYGDINGDGKLDQVLINFAGVCQGEASTIHPRPKAIYVQHVCSTSWWSSSESGNNEDTHIVVPPIIVKSVARPRGLINHLLGKALPTEQIGYDSIFLTSSGYVTSFNPFGHKNWQVHTTIQWYDKTRAADNPNYRYTSEGQTFYHAFMPSMLPYSLQIYGPTTYALITGWDNIILLDLEDGYTAAEHSLPCQPLESPVLADFNDDGWTDVIVYCPTGYVGMSVHSQPQYIYMTVLSVTIVLFMVLLSWCSQIDQSEKSDS